MLRFTLQTLAYRRTAHLDPSRVQAIQERRLRAMLHTAVQAPFFRDLYRGLDLDRVPLSELPTTNKAQLMADFDRTVTDPCVNRASLDPFLDQEHGSDDLYLGRYVAAHTSGSQGQPMFLVQPTSQLELTMSLQMSRGYAGRVSLFHAARRLFQPVRLAVVTLKHGFYPSATLFQHMPRAARRYVDLLWLSQTEPDVVERLNAFQPNVLTAYAGVLELLALEVEAGRLRLGSNLEQLVSNSEALTDKARERISAAFGHRVLDNYATGECPFLSNGCPTDAGAHVNSDWAILEVVDEQNRPVPDGQPGERVLITNLANSIQPFVRYEIGDIVTMADQPCRCGSRLPRIGRIDSRASDVFWVGDAEPKRRLDHLILAHIFEFLKEVREWQASQVGPNRIQVRLEPIPGATLDLARARQVLDRELRQYEFRNLQLDLLSVPRIEPDPVTGKQRRMLGPGLPASPHDQPPGIPTTPMGSGALLSGSPHAS